MAKKMPAGKFMAPVKVGPKGQIVIPKEVRDMFGIEPGDTLLLLADQKQGIAMQQMSLVNTIVNAIFGNKNASPEERFYAQEVMRSTEEQKEPGHKEEEKP